METKPEKLIEYSNTFLPVSGYKDHFGSSDKWKEEIEKWLVFAKVCDKQWYSTIKKRTKRENERDGVLGDPNLPLKPNTLE